MFSFYPHLQVYRKAVRKGFEFSLMVVGESGLGKSTLVRSENLNFVSMVISRSTRCSLLTSMGLRLKRRKRRMTGRPYR